MSWEDSEDEWTAAIKATHPTRSDSHEQYETALKMVGNRHSKGALVALVNWLLVERGAAADRATRAEAERDEARRELASRERCVTCGGPWFGDITKLQLAVARLTARVEELERGE